MTPSSILRGRAAVVLTVLVTAVALSACGSSSSNSSSAAASGTSVSVGNRQQARVALAKCLRAQGLNVPDPSANGTGGRATIQALQNVPPAKLTAARQACKSELSAAFPQANLNPAQRAQLQQQLVKFASCMRSHGINFPDPQIGAGGGPGFGRFGNVDRNSPAFAAAAKSCASLRPSFGRGGPGGPGA